MRTYQVTLLITSDEIEPPNFWDWNTLLDLNIGDGEIVKVEDVQLIADGEGTDE